MSAGTSLLKRFSGPSGKTRLINAFQSHTIVGNNRSIATALATQAKLERCAAGRLLIQQDGADNDLYLILSGEFAVTVNGRRVATRGPGLHLGEMALLDPAARRSATVTALTEGVVAKISDTRFAKIAGSEPELWKRVALEISNRLRQRNALVANRRARPVLFVGSSRESLNIATAICRDLRSRISVVPWSEGVFRPSKVNIEALEAQIPLLDFAVLVVSPDDRVVSRGKQSEAPRDNIVFELGLFMGALGRHRTFLVKPRGTDLKIPTDLLGIIPIEFSTEASKSLRKRLAPVSTELRKLITRTGTR